MFRFSIRDLMLIIFVCAIGFVWCYERRTLNEAIAHLEERVEFLEWKKTQVFTIMGSVSAASLDLAPEREEQFRKRFAKQPAPKAE